MRVMYFDTETTGLYDSEVCQLALVIDNGVEVYGRNFFFKVHDMNPEAQKVHGFSIEMLEILSGGKVFADYIDEIEQEFMDSDLIVAHNAAFDISMMRKEFERQGRLFRFNNYLCTMKFMTPHMKLLKKNGGGYKYPSLAELTATYVPDPCFIGACAKDLFGEMLRFHDARFDATALYLSVRAAQSDIISLKEKVCSSVLP